MFEKILDTRNPFWQFMGKLFDVFVLNILWIVTSVPVVTIGVAITAVYDTCFQLQRGENDGIIKPYFKSWRSNWKQSTAMGLILLLIVGVLIFDIWYFLFAQSYLTAAMTNIICAILTFVLILVLETAIYAFALQAIFENTVKQTLKNGLLLAVRHPLRSIGLLVFDLGFVAAMVLTVYYLPVASIALMMFGTALIIFINSLVLIGIFRKFMPEEADTTDESETYE